MQPANRFLTILKLFHLHAAYIFVGLEQEYFYLVRANYFADLKWYNFAIGNYKKALKKSNDPGIKAAVGWCYFQLGQMKKSVENYRKAYDKSKHPNIAIGLAYAEYNCGNIDECRKIVSTLPDSIFELDATHEKDIMRLKTLLEARP